MECQGDFLQGELNCVTLPCQTGELNCGVDFRDNPLVELARHIVTKRKQAANAINQPAHDCGLLWNVEADGGVCVVHVSNLPQMSRSARIILNLFEFLFFY